MIQRWLSLRSLIVLVSLGLIAVALLQMVEIRTPDRPKGSWEEIARLSDRDDLNVVFFLIDTLRADRLSAYGYERETSPVFDALAESGILFENVLAQSTWTKCSMASLWTSTYPASNGITRYPHGVPEPATLPSEIFQEAGFRTVGIWRNGWVAPNFGFDQGFDLYYKPPARGLEKLQQNNPSAFTLGGTDRELTEAAVGFLRGAGDERFFLYLHYMDLHQYVYSEGADFGTTYSDIYDQSIHWVDQNLGALVAALQEEGLMKKTVLVVASDHGEAFHEHGVEGHARNLYWETTRVPLLVTLPFRLREPVRVSEPVENVDIWPTVLDLLELPPLPGAQGRSLLPVVEAAARGEEPDGTAPIRYAHLDLAWGQKDKDPKPLVSASDGRYRLFHREDKPEEVELYDLVADAREQENVAEQQPEAVEALMERIAGYKEAPPPPWGGPDEVTLDEFELNQLRALGYVVDDENPPDRIIDLDEGKGGAPPGALDPD